MLENSWKGGPDMRNRSCKSENMSGRAMLSMASGSFLFTGAARFSNALRFYFGLPPKRI